MRILLLTVASALCLSAPASNAFAWGCIAVSDSGNAYGYSTDFTRRGEAKDRALDECTSRTDEICEIQECNEDD